MLKKNFSFFVIASFVLILVGGVFFINKKNNRLASKQPSTQTTKKSEFAHPVREFKIIARNWRFEPAEIKLKKGDKVRLIIKSIEVEHGFSLLAFGIDEKLMPGKETTVEFIADKKGTFPFFCSVYCGSGHGGMRGKLIVE